MKYKKSDIKMIVEIINHLIFISDNTYHEKFKQIKIKDTYIPYLISNFGRIFSIHYGKSKNINVKELKTNSNGTGYSKITIHYNNKHYNFWIHILVANAFIHKPKNKTDVNHKDGNKLNNYVWNLEWLTRKENVQHAEKNGLTHHNYGENNHSKISEATAIEICESIINNEPPKIIRDKFKISKNMFQSILHQRKWKYLTLKYDFSKYKYRRK